MRNSAKRQPKKRTQIEYKLLWRLRWATSEGDAGQGYRIYAYTYIHVDLIEWRIYTFTKLVSISRSRSFISPHSTPDTHILLCISSAICVLCIAYESMYVMFASIHMLSYMISPGCDRTQTGSNDGGHHILEIRFSIVEIERVYSRQWHTHWHWRCEPVARSSARNKNGPFTVSYFHLSFA